MSPRTWLEDKDYLLLPLLINTVIIILFYFKILGDLFINVLDSIVISIVIIVMLSIAILQSIYWSRISVLYYTIIVLTLILLVISLIVFPILKLNLRFSSFLLVWFAVILNFIALLSSIVVRLRLSSSLLASSIALLGLWIFISANTIFYVTATIGRNSELVLGASLGLSVLAILYMRYDPLYFFNLTHNVIALSIFPILFITTTDQYIATTVAALYLAAEIAITYLLLRSKLKWLITQQVHRYVLKNGYSGEIPISKLFDPLFVYDLYAMSDKLSHRLFEHLNGEIDWDFDYNGNVKEANLIIEFRQIFRRIIDYLSGRKSFKVHEREFFDQTRINKYILSIIIEKLSPYILWDQQNSLIYYFDQKFVKFNSYDVSLIDTIPEILDFCSHPVVLSKILKGGYEYTKKALLWTLENVKTGSTKKSRILKTIKKGYYPFDNTYFLKCLERKDFSTLAAFIA